PADLFFESLAKQERARVTGGEPAEITGADSGDERLENVHLSLFPPFYRGGAKNQSLFDGTTLPRSGSAKTLPRRCRSSIPLLPGAPGDPPGGMGCLLRAQYNGSPTEHGAT